MSHTPGPWETQSFGNGEAVVIANGSNRDDVACICSVAGGLGTVLEDNRDYESEANANLIAAAPELLEACKTAYNCLCNPIDGAQSDINLIHAAITKATGVAQ